MLPAPAASMQHTNIHRQHHTAVSKGFGAKPYSQQCQRCPGSRVQENPDRNCQHRPQPTTRLRTVFV